jgi:hypothetical protein
MILFGRDVVKCTVYNTVIDVIVVGTVLFVVCTFNIYKISSELFSPFADVVFVEVILTRHLTF